MTRLNSSIAGNPWIASSEIGVELDNVNAALVQVGLTFDSARLANSSVRKYHGAIEAGDHNSANQRAVEGRGGAEPAQRLVISKVWYTSKGNFTGRSS